MTDIPLFLIEEGLIDGATSVRFEPSVDGPRTRPHIATNRDDLIAAQGSKYCPTSTNLLVRECQRQGGRYLFIGTPCQVSALRMAARQDASVRKTFPYAMANFCGGYRDYRYLEGILRLGGVQPSEVVSFRFRGGGWPGTLRAETYDGRVFTQPYPHFRFSALVNKQRRCTLCVDGMGLLADFACGDAWIDRMRGEGHGWSVILTRSGFASDVIEKMVRTGRLVSQPVAHEEILHSQRFNLDSKIHRQRKRRRVFVVLGRTCPEFDVELPAGTTSYWREMKIIALKTRFMMALLIGWRFTAAGRVVVGSFRRLLRRRFRRHST